MEDLIRWSQYRLMDTETKICARAMQALEWEFFQPGQSGTSIRTRGSGPELALKDE